MEESHRRKYVRKKLWLSIALIGSLQYGGLITSIVTKRKKPFLSMMPAVAMYSLWLTKSIKRMFHMSVLIATMCLILVSLIL